MIDTNMPVWWMTIQTIGWSEILLLFIMLLFERKHGYLERIGEVEFLRYNPLLAIVCTVVVATPIVWAGLFACLSYMAWMLILYIITK